MRAEEIQGLMEAYSKVHETPEVLSEEVVEENVEQVDENQSLSAFSGLKSNLAKQGLERSVSSYLKTGSTKPAAPTSQSKDSLSAFSGLKSDLAKQGLERRVSGFLRGERPTQSGSPPNPGFSGGAGGGSRTAAAKPTAPGGSVPKPAGAKPPATPAAKPATPAPGTKAAGPESIKPKTPNPLLAGGEIRRMQQASQMRQKGINVTSDQLKAAERTKPAGVKEEYADIFDLVKGHLLDEGYAETEENALVMMANMSEQWRNSIIEGKKEFPHKKVDRQVYDAMDSGETAGDSGDSDKEKRDYTRAEKMRSVAAKHGGKSRVKEELKLSEAQRARENPEDHDKEEKKKYEKVRGEKTPMPPRGDKRREDFEKWYRANVR
jgi:hypothetical protein